MGSQWAVALQKEWPSGPNECCSLSLGRGWSRSKQTEPERACLVMSKLHPGSTIGPPVAEVASSGSMSTATGPMSTMSTSFPVNSREHHVHRILGGWMAILEMWGDSSDEGGATKRRSDFVDGATLPCELSQVAQAQRR